MASKKVYFSGKEQESELEIYMNTSEELFVGLDFSSPDFENSKWISLPKEDAIDIITELAYQFDLIDDSPELEGKLMWLGGNR